jgi:hypothetical protein
MTSFCHIKGKRFRVFSFDRQNTALLGEVLFACRKLPVEECTASGKLSLLAESFL